MGKLHHALPGLHFGELTPTMLTQQDRDKSGLYKDNCENERDLPGITLPHRWLPKQDFAPRWKAVLADAPTLHLPPVENYLVAEDFSRFLRRHRARQEP